MAKPHYNVRGVTVSEHTVRVVAWQEQGKAPPVRSAVQAIKVSHYRVGGWPMERHRAHRPPRVKARHPECVRDFRVCLRVTPPPS